ncbi:hypothetical protein HDV02_005219, partial [Globomyces sp. JEL0801]
LNTKTHCLYAYYFQGLNFTELAVIYGKTPSTTKAWVDKYNKGETLERKVGNRPKVFNAEQRQWIINFYKQRPTAYLNEAQIEFATRFIISISVSSVWSILNEAGFTHKVLERRAMQIKYTITFNS